MKHFLYSWLISYKLLVLLAKSVLEEESFHLPLCENAKKIVKSTNYLFLIKKIFLLI